MKTITFDQMPSVLATVQETVKALFAEVKEMRASQPVNEPPIDGDELRKRLQISRPTEISMRKRGKLPYLMVNGHYRYNWPEVLKKLSA
ncbi:MAG TPA: hypothetical protein PKE30_08245 [Niabella sp.]|nr:hypothetical protein [Niabella sp.]